MRNNAAPDNKTPTVSKRWGCVGSAGTRRTARNQATTPTGTLMKKIHSQPRPSTRTPPAIGPTSVATPAVAPHRPIAAPRWVAGKVRVMTAMVCGVIMAAPTPCRARAAMSSGRVPDSPHSSEESVKTTSPSR
jgi:hypothetical protein